jgi:ParB-like chromosome segregation protein Spo0J
MKKVKISEVKLNPNNPRLIKDDKFKKLVQSIKDFPEMLNIRPIVVNQDMIILGGNMRYKACKEAGLKEIPIIIADLTEEQQREFLIKDNTSGGEWDWDILANEWNSELLSDWGLDIPSFATDVDYSILDDDDVSEQLESMTDGVKKAIQIEFEAEHYEEAYALVKFWREKEAYVGSMIMEYLKAEKDKL